MYDEKRRNGELAAARDDGRAEGLAQGHAEGRAEGLEQGRAQGHAEGREEGIAEARIEMANKLKALGVDIDTIVQATGLTPDEVSSLKK